MSSDGLEQLSVIAGLIREKDGIALSRSLIDGLRRLSPGLEVTLLEVFGHRNMQADDGNLDASQLSVRRFDDTGHRVAEREQIDDLARIIQRMRPVALDDERRGVGRVIVPLAADCGPLRLVVLDEVPIDPWLRAKVMQVVEAYGNLVALMDSRERDALSGLLNRQTFATLFELAERRARAENGASLTVAVLDIDHFKRVNDTFGHLFGDEVLIHFARLMERAFRYTDDLFRFGGEEFVVLFSTPKVEQAGQVLERFRQRVEDYDFPGVGQVTVSIGYVSNTTSTLPTTLIDYADQALYHAKRTGRNRVVDYIEVDEQQHDASGVIDLF